MDTAITEAEQNRLILEHMNLVAPIARWFFWHWRDGKSGIPPDDLLQEGRRALVQAARQWRRDVVIGCQVALGRSPYDSFLEVAKPSMDSL